jgi:hypothetical protein
MCCLNCTYFVALHDIFGNANFHKELFIFCNIQIVLQICHCSSAKAYEITVFCITMYHSKYFRVKQVHKLFINLYTYNICNNYLYLYTLVQYAYKVCILDIILAM